MYIVSAAITGTNSNHGNIKPVSTPPDNSNAINSWDDKNMNCCVSHNTKALFSKNNTTRLNL